jgi:hypothetical protein
MRSAVVFVPYPYEMMKLSGLFIAHRRPVLTPLDNMTDEAVIQAAIALLQKKLNHIRCLSEDVSSEEYKKMQQLKDTSGINAWSANNSSV